MERIAPRLFIVPYLDEDVDTDLVTPLRKHGYEAYSVRDAGMRERSDQEQLIFASERSWTLVTHNVKDFKALHAKWQAEGREHSGIIVSKRMEIGRMLQTFRDQTRDFRPLLVETGAIHAGFR